MDVARSPEYKKQKKRRRILVGVLLTIALVFVTWGILSLEPAAREVDAASVWVEEVQRGEFLRSVRGPGTLVPEEIRWIAAETDARVEKIVLRPGAEIEPDSVIVLLSNPQLEQTVADAELALKRAEAQYQDLEAQLSSQLLNQEANVAAAESAMKTAAIDAEARRRLFEDGVGAEIEHRRAELAAEQTTKHFGIEQQRFKKIAESIAAQLAAQRAQVEQQEAIFELRKSQLDQLTVRAGIRGVLQEVPVEEGQRLTPGTNVARVARPDKLKAELRIAETQAKDIQLNQVARIDTRNGIIPGHVVRIAPSVQQGSVLVDVTLDVDQLPPGARPDLSVDGVIEISRIPDTLYIGRPAYGQANSTVGLFKVAEDNSAQRVQVKLGQLSVQEVQILEGLRQGDRVILSDSSQWDDVDRIRLR